MADVFISYSREDEAIARRVAKALGAAQLGVWWDADLPAHRNYSEIIERNLQEARAVVVLWSKTATKSQWVRAEADFARNAGKLVQAQVDGTMPPLPFNQIQCANLKAWRGSQSHPGWAKLKASVDALVSGEEPTSNIAPKLSLWDEIQPYRWWTAAGFLLLVAAAVLFMFFGQGAEEKKPVLAVLPFKSLDGRDEGLVAGMWEDTRQAIGRNPQLVVLGPHTAQELAGKGPGAMRHAADYLLQGSVRTAGDRIRISAGLVRTKDGAQLWSQNFDSRLDDVFALQTQIAREIEGRIRGRLASKGGVRPEHIATSGDVYALYSDARAKIRKREFQQYPAARDELQEVVKADPNFAPAWASLSVVYKMLPPDRTSFNQFDRAQYFARKAVELAPNLAAGHAALALALDLEGPVARAELERAVKLDPNDFEAVLWLGNTFNSENRDKEALFYYTRAAEIEPLFWPAVLNKLAVLQSLRDKAGIQQLIDRTQRLGSHYIVAAIKMELAAEEGDLGEAANIGIDYWKTGEKDGRPLISQTLWPILLLLGFEQEAVKISPAPDFAPYLWRNDPKGLDMVDALHIAPRRFFSMAPLTQNAGRVYVLSGRASQLADMYLSLKVSPGEFANLSGGGSSFLLTAPIVAVALRATGHREAAANLLLSAEGAAMRRMKDGEPVSQVLLARVYAAQNRKDEALPLLATAVNDKWMPMPPLVMPDIATDPAFASLKGDPRFERIRQQILGTIRRERAQVQSVDLD